jgi:hypothetical protein
MSDEEDPYAVSSDSEDEGHKKPPPKIAIEGRSTTDLKQIVSFTFLYIYGRSHSFINFHSRRRYWSELFNNANANCIPVRGRGDRFHRILSRPSFACSHQHHYYSQMGWIGCGVRVTFPPPGKQMIVLSLRTTDRSFFIIRSGLQ